LGLLPDISVESIKDKSKADKLAKALVIVQASWLILQCVMRWIAQLPVTPLELNTLAHGICALMVYYLWWEKPLDVQSPTLVTAEGRHALTALAWVCSGVRSRRRPECKDIAWFCDSADVPEQYSSISANGQVTFVDIELNPRRLPPPNLSEAAVPFLRVPYNLAHTAALPREYGRRSENPNPSATSLLGSARGNDATRFADPEHPEDDAMTIRRWKLCFQFVKECPGSLARLQLEVKRFAGYRSGHIGHYYIRGGPLMLRKLPSSKEPIMIDEAVRNWPSDLMNDLTPLEWSTATIIFCMSALAYGGIHASAWGEHFPSNTEQLLWRISCIYMGASGVLFTAIAFQYQVQNQFEADQWQYRHVRVYGRCRRGVKEVSEYGRIRWLRKTKFWRKMRSNIFPTGIMVVSVLVLLFYCFVRGFFVVEAFISLRLLPHAAYDTPSWSWTQYLAHL